MDKNQITYLKEIDTQSYQKQPFGNRDLTSLSRIFFVLWGFPEKTQTFIQREMEEMARLGVTVNVLAGSRVSKGAISPTISSIEDRTIYLDAFPGLILNSIKYIIDNPKLFFRTLKWSILLPHRTWWHRIRMVAMLIAATAVAKKIEVRGCVYLHAHFASYHTEWAMCLSRLLEIPYGLTAHATGLWKDRNIIVEKIKNARTAITCTNFNVLHMKKLVPEKSSSIHLVHHGLDFNIVNAIYSAFENVRSRWLAVGRLVPKKGYTHLIRAMAQLREWKIDSHLSILGDGHLRKELQSEIDQLDLNDCIELFGMVPQDTVWNEMNLCSSLIVPSVEDAHGDIDGIPNVILEAMAMGKPVIGTNISGIPEVVLHNVTGIIVPTRDFSALAGAMKELHENPVKAGLLGKKASEIVKEQFNIRTNTLKQLRHLLEAMNTKD